MPTLAQHVVVLVAYGLLLLGNNAHAQNYVEGQVIVKFTKGMTEKEVRDSLDESMFYVAEPLMPSKGLYLLKSKVNMTTRQAIEVLTRTDSVLNAQPDHLVTLRNTTPNDPKFKDQWSLSNANGANIGVLDAWQLGFGGKDRSGHDIVVAIVDGGMDTRHPDLVDNLWVNKGEIAGNDTDDDNNGYVDDINGWNAFDGDGSIPANYHGTHVGGIVGAKGNNGLLVSGVNWNVKLMPVAAASNRTSVVIKGYNYILEQKKLFIQTNGSKGANVVATNSSFGVDYADCTENEYQAWNDAYDALGEVGILSAAAAPNNAVDVDEVGDVPTGCSSEYIVSVTNTTKTDNINNSAGYGATTIDIGAPGTDILSTLPGKTVGNNTGTSMATPHISGAIAFMYSVASEGFHQTVKSNPAQAALALKQTLLRTVKVIGDLDGQTVSNGRLDLGRAAQAINSVSREEVLACFY